MYKLTGKETLGIEFGSTRIKAVLIDENGTPIANGGHTWENKFENGFWTYSNEDIWSGIQDAYVNLNKECEEKFGEKISTLASFGISGMMHGYLPFDKNGNQLAEFRTWRNNTTTVAAEKLTETFGFNIPERWSIAHLYQAILNNEEHVKDIDYLTTLAGYVHWKLTGEKVIGIGEASGMFPIDSENMEYNQEMLDKFSKLEDVEKYGLDISEILPNVLSAGQIAGRLTEEGARLLDPSGTLQAGIIMVPPEGDAGTGMVATNSVAEKTGNISAGTSIFSMVVLNKMLKNTNKVIDMVTTPDGKPVAMVHCNNCCTEMDQWVNVLDQYNKLMGIEVPREKIYETIYNAALNAAPDAGGLINFNYISGEQVSDVENGIPMFIRPSDSVFSFENFARSQIYSCIATLKLGMESLLYDKNIEIDCLTGHGGLFKIPVAGQKLMAGAMETPVAVMETAGEGGAWGMAILAKYAVDGNGRTLSEYLEEEIFSKCSKTIIEPDLKDINGFKRYVYMYEKYLEVEKKAGNISMYEKGIKRQDFDKLVREMLELRREETVKEQEVETK